MLHDQDSTIMKTVSNRQPIPTGFIRDTETGECICPDHEYILSGHCQCLPGFGRNVDGDCVCPNHEVIDQETCICAPG
jgi:hypothetical protein